MKTTGKLRFVTIIAVATVLGFAFSSFSAKNKNNPDQGQIIMNDVDVKITIDRKTSQSEFEDIMDMLKEHDIKGSFTNIKRNEEGEITSIKIELEDMDSGSKSVSNMQSSTPIQPISLGRKNGMLYINAAGNSWVDHFGFGGNFNLKEHKMDSIFGHRFHIMDSLRSNVFSFDNEDGSLFMFNGKSFDIDDMMDDMHDMFEIEEDENGDKRIIIKGGKSGGLNFFHEDDDHESTVKNQRFRFIDDPNTEKIIIIDGKESTFEKLDALAKDDELDTVDVLKSKTAISLYGQKAKDGAIIATTKQ